jgi:hypothetical protein
MRNRYDKEFPVVSLCREDLALLGYPSNSLCDSKMRQLAEALAEELYHHMFCNSLDAVALKLKVPGGAKRRMIRRHRSMLKKAHREEINRKGAEPVKFGEVFSATRIETVTDRGMLSTGLEPRSEELSHRWHEPISLSQS